MTTCSVQLLLSVLVFALSCVASYFSRQFMYDQARPPLIDMLQQVLPNLGGASFRVYLVVGTAIAVFLLFVVVIFSLAPHCRRAVLRRWLVVAACSQFATVVMQGATTTPDPDPRWRHDAFVMFSVVFSAIACYAVSYLRPSTATDTSRATLYTWRIVFIAVTLFGNLVAVACHVVYTVDVLCMCFTTAAVFFIYEWHGRSPASIRQCWKLFAWFEADAIAVNEEDDGDTRHHVPHPCMPLGLPVLSSTDALDDSELDGGGGDAEPKRRDVEKALVEHVHEHMSERTKSRRALTGGLCTVMMTLVQGIENFLSGDVADGFRPLLQPPFDDIGFKFFEQLGFTMSPPYIDALVVVFIIAVAMDCIFLQPLPLTSARRALTVYGTCFALRFFFVISTLFVDPSPECKLRVHPDSPTCGDCMFSGHAATFLTGIYWVLMFRNGRPLKILMWIFVPVALLLVIATRLHYTRDVLTAVVVFTSAMFFWEVTVFRRPDRIGRSEALFSFECDYYVALDRLMFGFPTSRRDHQTSASHDGIATPVPSGYGATEAEVAAARPPEKSTTSSTSSHTYAAADEDAATSVCDALRFRFVRRIVRPTGKLGPWARAWLRSPITEGKLFDDEGNEQSS